VRSMQATTDGPIPYDDPHKGWFGASALKAMPNFEREFICDPALPHWGVHSWDAFFTREFRSGVRPVASPDDDRVIVNICEAAPYRLAPNVSYRDIFWIKSQPYSIAHMLANDKLAPLVAGATVYQAYLNPLSYHRAHSPASGTVVKAYVQDGTYYVEAASHGFDPAGQNDSQGYITALATRAIIFLEANDPSRQDKSGRRRPDVADRNLSSESGGFDSLAAKANH
jgi:phosphatidylserine decarboxylase